LFRNLYFGFDFENKPENNTMKAIILFSSIFYILGLKIGNKIDLVKKSNPVDKIITQKVEIKKPEKCCEYTKELAEKTVCDTTKGGISYSDALLKSIVY